MDNCKQQIHDAVITQLASDQADPKCTQESASNTNVETNSVLVDAEKKEIQTTSVDTSSTASKESPQKGTEVAKSSVVKSVDEVSPNGRQYTVQQILSRRMANTFDDELRAKTANCVVQLVTRRAADRILPYFENGGGGGMKSYNRYIYDQYYGGGGGVGGRYALGNGYYPYGGPYGGSMDRFDYYSDLPYSPQQRNGVPSYPFSSQQQHQRYDPNFSMFCEQMAPSSMGSFGQQHQQYVGGGGFGNKQVGGGGGGGDTGILSALRSVMSPEATISVVPEHVYNRTTNKSIAPSPGSPQRKFISPQLQRDQLSQQSTSGNFQESFHAPISPTQGKLIPWTDGSDVGGALQSQPIQPPNPYRYTNDANYFYH